MVLPLQIGIIPPSHHFRPLKIRFSLASQGIKVQGGIIDSDYHGELKVILQHDTDKKWICRKGDCIAQLLGIPCKMWPVSEIDPRHLLTQ